MSTAEPTEASRITVNGHEQGVQEHWISNADVAGAVRMLMRDQFDHERVCTLGRDRIVFLDQELRRALAALADLSAERDAMADVLARARDQFKTYAEGHRRKADNERLARIRHGEYLKKAETNEEMAAACDAAISGIAPRDGWRDIASAPEEEGISFLVLRPTHDGPPIIEQVSRFEGRLYPDALEGAIDWGDGIETATRWRPLPSPPEKECG
ncbi:hypothetical protein UFOVP860_72 [uncultured Caudovirales phage]|uniref:DUF551 domain-containing protein n=1 Tax=uncultured Caudovirales phage TaxID=2100421 RepID=A0A6J5T424_9CAUD|nr:hypothetical protein UFOVP860_72 [uncultured Caudovirales phage]CAB4195508.1 hypothetical protein UFOVP1293_39 [uncultured Caudovirales phage]CAB4222535.1 hypothetical protein UFOVP1644_57 [uncultured Caudovirales phage]